MKLSSSPRFASRSLFAKIALGLALVATPMLSQTASAHAMRDPQTITLTWRTSDSASVIHSKLLRQARRACKMTPTYSLAFLRAKQACVADIMNQAVAGIGSAELSQHHLVAARPSHG